MRPPLPAFPPAAPGSLAAALAAVSDPRHPYGWRPDCPPLPLVGLLQLAGAAMLCGAHSLYAVAQWGRERTADEPAALVPLGLPPGRSPCVATLHRVFKALAVAAFEQALGTWLAVHGVASTEAIPGWQDLARHPRRRGARGAPGGRLRPPDAGGARPSRQSRQGAGTGGSQAGAGGGAARGPTHHGGCAAHPARDGSSDCGGGWRLVLQPSLIAWLTQER